MPRARNSKLTSFRRSGADESSILKAEILPEAEDEQDGDEDEGEDYDISVIIDATKMPDPTDATSMDLEAVALNDDDDTLITEDYTVSQEVDYKIMEQSYTDEATATEALSAELKKAADDIAQSLDDADATIQDTGINAHGSVDDLDVTAQLPANDDDEDSADPTVSMELGGK